MKRTRTVGVKELKNKLSAYLREVRSGDRFLVTDHGEVVAELSQPAFSGRSFVIPPLLEEWIQQGKVSVPSLDPQYSRPRVEEAPYKFPEGTGDRLLNEERGE